MGKKFGNGLLAALEDAEEILEGEAAPVGEDPAADAMLEVADTTEEVGEGVAAIESLSLAIEEATDEVEEVSNVLDTVEEVSGGEEGGEGGEGEGLSEGEAVLAEEAFRQAFRRLNGSMSQSRIMPSLESFKSTNSRKTATRIGLENVMDGIKSVWEKIIAALRTLWNKIKSMWKKFMDGNLSLEKAAKAMKEKIKKSKNKVFKGEEDKFESERLTALFPTSNSLSSRDVVEFLNAHHQLATASSATVTNSKTVLDRVKGAVTENGKPSLDNVSVQSSTQALMTALSITGNPETSEGDHEYVSPIVLVGGVNPVLKSDVTTSESESDEKPAESSASFSFSYKEKEEKHENKNVEIASLSELQTVCDKVTALAKDNGTMVKNIETLKKHVDNTVDVIEKWINKSGGSEDRGVIRTLRKNGRLTSSFARVVGVMMSSLAGQNIRAGKAALGYVSAVFAKY